MTVSGKYVIFNTRYYENSSLFIQYSLKKYKISKDRMGDGYSFTQS